MSVSLWSAGDVSDSYRSMSAITVQFKSQNSSGVIEEGLVFVLFFLYTSVLNLYGDGFLAEAR